MSDIVLIVEESIKSFVLTISFGKHVTPPSIGPKVSVDRLIYLIIKSLLVNFSFRWYPLKENTRWW